MRKQNLKNLIHYLNEKELHFKTLEEVSPKDLGSRKKIGIYHSVTINSDYYAIFIVESKSRFLRKNANDLMEMLESLKSYKNHNYKHQMLVISSPLCSKAKALLEENGWRVENEEI
jgi:hypothetical protein